MFTANAASQLLVLLTLPIVLRKLGIDGWEQVVLAQIVINNVLWIVCQGFHFTGTVLTAQTKSAKKKQRILISITFIQLAILILSSFFLILLSFWESGFLSKDIIINSALISLSSIITFHWFLVGMSLFKYLALIKVVPKLILLVCIFTEPFGMSSVTFLYYISFSELVVGLYVFHSIMGLGYLRRTRVKTRFLKYLFLKSFKYFIIQFIPNIKDSCIKVFLNLFMPAGTLAIYSVAERLKGAGISIFQPILHVSFPEAASSVKKTKKEYLNFLFRIIKVQISLSATAALIFVLFSDFIVEWFAGNEFTATVSILKIWAASVVTVPLIEIILNHVFVANNKLFSYFASLLVHSIMTMSLVGIGIWINDLTAVIIGIVGAEIIFLICLVVYLIRIDKLMFAVR